MPNRILKESICVSESIDSLSWFEEVLFYRLIVNCDDFGRFDGRTAVIKNRLFPLKDDLTLGTVKAAIQKLVSAGLVITYRWWTALSSTTALMQGICITGASWCLKTRRICEL